jgi:hypothetical protein
MKSLQISKKNKPVLSSYFYILLKQKYKYTNVLKIIVKLLCSEWCFLITSRLYTGYETLLMHIIFLLSNSLTWQSKKV